MTTEAPVIDVKVRNEGSIILLTPHADVGSDWIDENIGPDNGFQPYYPTVVVEHRYADDIIDGMTDAGLIVSVE